MVFKVFLFLFILAIMGGCINNTKKDKNRSTKYMYITRACEEEDEIKFLKKFLGEALVKYECKVIIKIWRLKNGPS